MSNHKMNKVMSLDETYSTTRRVIKAAPEVVAELIKRAAKPGDDFKTELLLANGEGRQGEGGLRTQGHFKVGGLISEHVINSSTNPAIENDTKKSITAAFHEASVKGGILIPGSTSINEFKSPGSKSVESKPLITVITVVYNGQQFLEETILSVINQTYDNVEYIIIDGGSIDGSVNIIRKYEHAIDYWVSEKDNGIYDAMNKGIELATGEWINFMNAGDHLLGIPYDDLDARFSVVYGNEKNSRCEQQPLPLNYIKYGEMIACHQAMFFNKRKIKHYTDYKIYADYHLIMEIYKSGGLFLYVNKPICFYADGGVSSFISKTKRIEKYSSVYKGFGMTGLLKAILFRWLKIKI